MTGNQREKASLRISASQARVARKYKNIQKKNTNIMVASKFIIEIINKSLKRTQLNINIDPVLLSEIKSRAMMSGKTLSSFIIDIISQHIKEEEDSNINYRVNTMESRLNKIEDMLSLAKRINQKNTPFTNIEAENCTNFTRAIFDQITLEKGFSSKKEAWNDYLPYITIFDQWNTRNTLRLQEVLLIEDSEPWQAMS